MTKEQFLDWKQHPATKVIFDVFLARIDQGRDELEASAGFDSISDAKKSGKLAAYRDIVSITYEDLIE